MSRSGYAPRPEPTPIPSQNWNDEPTQCLQVNEHWVGHILGALEVLDQPDTWIGTDEEIQAARDNVNEIMAAWKECEGNGLVVGEYKMLSHNVIPEKWLLCRGGILEKIDYPELYAVIGGLYDLGGETSEQFRLPDFGLRSPMGAPTDQYVGARGGDLTQTLIVANLPPHTHQMTNNVPLAANRHTGVAGANPSMAFTNGTTNSADALRTQATGSGSPFSIIHPILHVNVIIYAGR